MCLKHILGACILPQGGQPVVRAATAPADGHNADISAAQLPHGLRSRSSLRSQSRDWSAGRSLPADQRGRPGDLRLPAPGRIRAGARLHGLYGNVGRLERAYSWRRVRSHQAGRFIPKALLIIRPGNGSPRATNVDLLVLLVVISTKAFSFHNRSSSNFAYTLVTTLSTIAPCRIFKLSPN